MVLVVMVMLMVMENAGDMLMAVMLMAGVVMGWYHDAGSGGVGDARWTASNEHHCQVQ